MATAAAGSSRKRPPAPVGRVVGGCIPLAQPVEAAPCPVQRGRVQSLCSLPYPLPGVTLGLTSSIYCSFNYMLIYLRGQHQDSSRPLILCRTRSWELMHSSGTLAICSGSFHLDQGPPEGADQVMHLEENHRAIREVFTFPPPTKNKK